MKEVNINVGLKTYKVKVAIDDADLTKGLQGVDSLPENGGMLFMLGGDEEYFWMKDTNIPLDIIFIDEDLQVIDVKHGKPNSEEHLWADDTSYVLEVNENSGIKVGDSVDINPDKKTKENKMQVLDSDGNTQMELVGGERIFSRKNTKVLIKFAKKADLTQKDSDFKALGKRVFKFINIQDTNEPEYVEK